MQAAPANPLVEANAALSEARWADARAAFEAALEGSEDGLAAEGLSRALWWLGDEDGAVAMRERAHVEFHRRGDVVRAVRAALWLSDEYRTVYGNEAAANGWLTRADRLLRRLDGDPAHGWLALTRAARAPDPAMEAQYAEDALGVAQTGGDTSLEARALSRLGHAEVSLGRIDSGVGLLDEAMALAIAQDEPEALGDVACLLMESAELVGALDRFVQWAPVIEQYLERHRHLSLFAACGTCCGALFAAGGNWEGAETELLRSILTLEEHGHRSRCVHPAARLAELRIRQGRLEEARTVIEPYAGMPEAVVPLATLDLLEHRPDAAASRIERRLLQTGRANLGAVPLLGLLVKAKIGLGDPDAAGDIACDLEDFADRCGMPGPRAHAAFAAGRILLAAGDAAAATGRLQEAGAEFERAGLQIDAAMARLELARAMRDSSPGVAVEEARDALRRFEQAGAGRLAGEAAAFLRQMGVRGQRGPRGVGRLTRREQDVLELIALGLTNAEIADRLFISAKTAANHVSNVLLKLGVRSRTEAAALAVRLTPFS